MKKILAVAACAAVMGMAGVASATPVELIENGDFEAGSLTGSLTDWTSYGTVQLAKAGSFAELQGMDNYFALLGKGTSDGTSTLRQDVDLTGIDLSQEIEITFDWAFDYWDNSASAEDTFLAFVRQDGSPSKKITMLDLTTQGTGFWSPDGGIAYGTYTDTLDLSAYTTDEARTIFRLIEESDSGFWTGTASLAGIDNVSITGTAAVPEPTTMLLFGTGLAGLAGVARRKRN